MTSTLIELNKRLVELETKLAAAGDLIAELQEMVRGWKRDIGWRIVYGNSVSPESENLCPSVGLPESSVEVDKLGITCPSKEAEKPCDFCGGTGKTCTCISKAEKPTITIDRKVAEEWLLHGNQIDAHFALLAALRKSMGEGT